MEKNIHFRVSEREWKRLVKAKNKMTWAEFTKWARENINKRNKQNDKK